MDIHLTWVRDCAVHHMSVIMNSVAFFIYVCEDIR